MYMNGVATGMAFTAESLRLILKVHLQAPFAWFVVVAGTIKTLGATVCRVVIEIALIAEVVT